MDSTEVTSGDVQSIMEKIVQKGRRRDRTWIEELKEDGAITPVPSKKSKFDVDGKSCIIHFIDANGKKFDYVQCANCKAVLATPSGGHWSIHKKRQCTAENSVQNSKETESIVKNSIANYCLTSGSSFRHLESESFQKMLRECMSASNPNSSPDSIKLPGRQAIRDLVEKKCEERILEIATTLKPQIQERKATLCIDFGLHICNFLSGFVSFVDHSNGVPALKVLPYCFMPMYLVKSSENVRDELVKAGERFGLTREDVLSMNLVSDGAKNLVTMGNRYFKSWSLCSCHALQKMSERFLEPTKKMRDEYFESELQQLDYCANLLKKCAKLALLVHKNKRSLNVPKLPTLYVETRWMTAVTCAKDIEELIPVLKNSTIFKISDLAYELDEDLGDLNSCTRALSKFVPLLSLFEGTSVTIHLYLPIVYDLHKQFCKLETEATNHLTKTLSKSGKLITEEYLKNKISDLHLKASLLTPRFKNMKKFSEDHKKKAVTLLKTEFEEKSAEEVGVSDDCSSSASQVPNQKFAFLYDETDFANEKDEYDSYMKEKVTAGTPECPLVYWTEKKAQFPVLFKIAMNVFSALSSESVCERAFSAVKRVVRDDRHQLKPDFIEKIMVGFFHANEYE